MCMWWRYRRGKHPWPTRFATQTGGFRNTGTRSKSAAAMCVRIDTIPLRWRRQRWTGAYVETNPVRAGRAAYAADVEWSSARAHLGRADGDQTLALEWWRERWTVEGWSAFLAQWSGAPEELKAIRQATYRGRPLGSKRFVAELEQKLGRRLGHTGPQGRKIGSVSGRANDRRGRSRPSLVSTLKCHVIRERCLYFENECGSNTGPFPRPIPSGYTLYRTGTGYGVCRQCVLTTLPGPLRLCRALACARIGFGTVDVDAGDLTTALLRVPCPL